MTMKKNTCLGEINVTIGAIASLTGAAVSECIGVVGMASKQFFRDGIAVLFKQDNYSRGVVVRKTAKGIELDLILRGEVEVNENEIEHTLKAIDDFLKINVFNQSIMEKSS